MRLGHSTVSSRVVYLDVIHLLVRGDEREAALPVEPVRARRDAETAPTVARIEFADRYQQSMLGRAIRSRRC